LYEQLLFISLVLLYACITTYTHLLNKEG